ncbi:hypothetical protein IAU59_003561 [Kwoniella sp. CBS 9459]
MFCEPASRPHSPFHAMSPHAHTQTHGLGNSHAFGHAHGQPFFPAAASSSQQMPLQQSHVFPTLTRPAFQPHFSSPGPSTSSASSTTLAGPSQPTPIPSAQSAQYPISMPTTPAVASSSQSQSRPHVTPSQSQSHKFGRPRPIKKPSGSTSHKQRNVQMSLEVKVEKAKGFHAFFVPLCKGLPPAPPCSPVHSHGSLAKTNGGNDALSSPSSSSSSSGHSHELGGGADVLDGQTDYFGIWGNGKERDQWVEDVEVRRGDGMEVDRAY